MRGLTTGALMLLLFCGCTTYEITGIRTAEFAPDETFKRVGIGFFEVQGAGNAVRTQRNFYDALAYCLQEKGYTLTDAGTTRDLMIRGDIPADRLLSPNEVLQFAGRFSGRILLQGRLQETRTDRLVETQVQVMVQVNFHDMKTGQKLGEIVLFGKDLEFNTARETMTMAKKATEKLDELLFKRK